MSTTFYMQGRLVEAWNGNQQPIAASVFGAFAMKERTSSRVHVELSSDRLSKGHISSSSITNYKY